MATIGAFPLVLAGIVALAAALRLYQLDVRNVWLDEAISLWVARLPWDRLLPTLASFDEHPPLYFALLHVWLAGGDGEFWVRLLSVLCSTAAVAFAGLLGHRLVGRGGGFLAALFMALSPAQIHHAQDTRMYALVSALIMATTCAALRAVTSSPGQEERNRPGHRAGSTATDRIGGRSALLLQQGWAAGWALGAALVAATNHAAALVVGAQLLLAALAALRRRSRRMAVAVASVGSFVLWLPIAPVLLTQVRTVAQDFWIPRPSAAYTRTVLLEATIGVPPPPNQIQLSDRIVLTGPQDLALGLIALPRGEPLRQLSLQVTERQETLLIVLAALVGFGVYAAWRRAGGTAALLLAGSMILPVVALVVVSQTKPLLLSRAIIGSGSLALILAAAACVVLPRPLRPLAIALVLLWELLTLGQHWWYSGGEHWQETAAQLASQARPGELVLINGRWTQLPLDYYLRHYPDARLVERGVPVDYAERGKPEPVISEADLPRLRALTAGRERVWLVLSQDFFTDSRKLTRATLEADFPCFEVWPRPGVSLLLFQHCPV